MTKRFDTIIAVPWFRRDRYEAARARMADAVDLPERYNDWLAGAEKRESEIRRQGSTPFRVDVDDDAFFAFCADRGEPVDGYGRMRFARHAVTWIKPNMDSYEVGREHPLTSRRKRR